LAAAKVKDFHPAQSWFQDLTSISMDRSQPVHGQVESERKEPMPPFR
jgi:hypothetical protein